jgi:hypothetical protein
MAQVISCMNSFPLTLRTTAIKSLGGMCSKLNCINRGSLVPAYAHRRADGGEKGRLVRRLPATACASTFKRPLPLGTIAALDGRLDGHPQLCHVVRV